MSTSHRQNADSSSQNDDSMKIAVAISLLRSKLLHKQNQNRSTEPPPSASESEALRWKRKAKDRKQELLRLREELREVEDDTYYDLFPQSASCKCYFFDNLGKLIPSEAGDGSDHRFNDVLRRRFLRQVRVKERRRRRNGDSTQRRRFTDLSSEGEMEQLKASVDFLVELCDTVSPVEEANFANWSHQAVDFVLASLKNLLSVGRNMETIEGIISSLIVRLVRRMCSSSKEDDPFDVAFPKMHACMFLLIQLIEFLISDYLLNWSSAEGFDNILFEEWVKSVLHARKAVVLLESRNGLYVLYMDRVTGLLAKQVNQVSSLQKMINRDILDNLVL